MASEATIYVLGSGAIGFPLAAYLTRAVKAVVAVRTSRTDVPRSTVPVTLRDGDLTLRIPVETVSLSRLDRIDGTIVVAESAHAAFHKFYGSFHAMGKNRPRPKEAMVYATQSTHKLLVCNSPLRSCKSQITLSRSQLCQ